MEINDDKSSVKDRILDDLGSSIKLIQRYALCGYEGVIVIGNDSWLVQSLCHLLDLILRHGLRDHHRGYWPIVRELSHSDTLKIIQSLKSVITSLGKGRAWLYYTLTEGTFQSYLHCLCQDTKILQKNYVTQALLRDTSRTQQLLTLLAGLEQVQFNLDPDVTYLDVAAYQQQHSEVSSDLLPSCGDPSNLGPHMTSSITSSLASPVDSGVALLDSDADATSVSEATINEGDSLSLRDDKEDVSAFNEMEDNRINHQLLSMETSSGKKYPEDTKLDSKSHNLKNSQNISMDEAASHKCQHPETAEEVACHHDKILGSDYSFKYTACSAKVEVPTSVTPEVSARSSGRTSYSDTLISSEEEAVDTPSAFRGRAFSTMTASDIANQNVSEDIVIPPELFLHGVFAPDVFVESNNRVNSKVIPLEKGKRDYNSPSVNKECDTLADCTKSLSDNDDIVYRRQCGKKKRINKGSGSSTGDNMTKVKRVSFHENLIVNESDINKSSGAEFSVSFLPPDSVIKRDAVKGRYSWCGEGDAPFVRRRNNDNDTKSEVFLSSSTMNCLPDNTIFVNDRSAQLDQSTEAATVCTDNLKYHQSSNLKEIHSSPELSHTPPVTERGTPEGQEDPPDSGSMDLSQKQDIRGTLHDSGKQLNGSLRKLSSLSTSVDWSDNESLSASDTEFVCNRGRLISSFKDRSVLNNLTSSLLDIHSSKISSQFNSSQKGTPLGFLPIKDVASKNSLLNKFMKSITEKKFAERKEKLNLRTSRSLYISAARKFDQVEAMENFKSELDAEMGNRVNTSLSCPEINKLEEMFRSQVFLNPSEVLYKMHKVRSFYSSDGNSRPLLALLTNCNLYLTGVKSNYSYCNHFIIPYTELDAMLVGPNSQTVLLASVNRKVQFLVMTGDRVVTEELVSHIEFGMRRASSKISLPAVRILQLEDLKALQYGLAQEIPLLQDEPICHYSLVHLQDDHVSPPATPMGPTKEGHLMFRPASDTPLQPWEPGFFMLKAGVVYMFGDKCQRLPKRVIPLRGSACKGCRRIPNAERPHTFEILLGPRRSIQFAAADEYEASDWLQAFVQAATGLYEEEQMKAVPCSLVVTERYLVTCQENVPTSALGSGQMKILSCAAIQDLISFTLDSFQHSWCILEFGCHEVHENSGDWVLYFASSAEMCSFKDALQQLWLNIQQTDFPLCSVVDDALAKRCAETSSQLTEVWNVLLPLASQASL